MLHIANFKHLLTLSKPYLQMSTNVTNPLSTLLTMLIKSIVNPSVKNALLFFFLGLISYSSIIAQNDKDYLKKEIIRLEKISRGTVGVGIIHLETGREVTYNDGHHFPMASTYKIPIAVQVLKKVEEGKIRLDSMVTLSKNDARGRVSRFLGNYNASLSVLNLLELMMLVSDNGATDLCMKLAGGPSAINKMMKKNGLKKISVDRPTYAVIANFNGINWSADKKMDVTEFRKAASLVGREKTEKARQNFSKDLRDQSTPTAMARLLAMIWKGKMLNEKHTNLILDIMYRCETGENRIKGLLPPGTRVSHKTGTIGGTTNDVGIISLPDEKGHIAIVVFIKDSKIEVSEREEVIAHISRAAYDYFLFN